MGSTMGRLGGLDRASLDRQMPDPPPIRGAPLVAWESGRATSHGPSWGRGGWRCLLVVTVLQVLQVPIGQVLPFTLYHT